MGLIVTGLEGEINVNQSEDFYVGRFSYVKRPDFASPCILNIGRIIVDSLRAMHQALMTMRLLTFPD